MGKLSKISSSVEIFTRKIFATELLILFALLLALPLRAEDKSDLEIGAFTPEKAIDLLIEEPLGDLIKITKDEKGQICHYENKTVHFSVKFCDNPKKGVMAGTIIHLPTKQAVSFYFELVKRENFSPVGGLMLDDFWMRTLEFIYPYEEPPDPVDPNYVTNSPACQISSFANLNATGTGVSGKRQNWARCGKNAAQNYVGWLKSGERLMFEVNDQLLLKLTALYNSKLQSK